MGRLTWNNPDGTWGLKNMDIKEVPKELYGAVCKLKDYEETGLMPSQIIEMDELYAEKCKEVAKLQKEMEECKAELDKYKQLQIEFDLEGKTVERLTMEYCDEYMPKELCSIDRFGDADDCDLCCEYCKATEEGNEGCTGCAINQCFNKLGEYENLEEQGKLLRLPCKVGDTVYLIRYGVNADEYLVVSSVVFEIDIYGKEIYFKVQNTKGFKLDDFGKIAFLTKEQAESVLKEMESE